MSPDLELRIRRRGPRTLELELHSDRGLADIHHRQFRSVELACEPGAYFEELFGEIEQAALDRQAHEVVPRELESLGTRLFQLLPDDLGRQLWSLRNGDHSLLILSQEPWIPWELVRLQGVEEERIVPGPYLCDAYAVSRWLEGVPLAPVVPLGSMALVAPEDAGLPGVGRELQAIREVAREGLRTHVVEAEPKPVLKSLEAGEHDGWHFSGHGQQRQGAEAAEIRLRGRARLRPVHLESQAPNLGRGRRPLVMFNACQTGRSGWTLTGMGGWAQALVRLRVGAFLGAYWSVEDSRAAAFAEHFYRQYLAGETMARAVQKARRAIRSEGSADWLAYTLYAHPGARTVDNAAIPPPVGQGHSHSRRFRHVGFAAPARTEQSGRAGPPPSGSDEAESPAVRSPKGRPRTIRKWWPWMLLPMILGALIFGGFARLDRPREPVRLELEARRATFTLAGEERRVVLDALAFAGLHLDRFRRLEAQPSTVTAVPPGSGWVESGEEDGGGEWTPSSPWTLAAQGPQATAWILPREDLGRSERLWLAPGDRFTVEVRSGGELAAMQSLAGERGGVELTVTVHDPMEEWAFTLTAQVQVTAEGASPLAWVGGRRAPLEATAGAVSLLRQDTLSWWLRLPPDRSILRAFCGDLGPRAAFTMPRPLAEQPLVSGVLPVEVVDTLEQTLAGEVVGTGIGEGRLTWLQEPERAAVRIPPEAPLSLRADTGRPPLRLSRLRLTPEGTLKLAVEGTLDRDVAALLTSVPLDSGEL